MNEAAISFPWISKTGKRIIEKIFIVFPEMRDHGPKSSQLIISGWLRLLT
jgi:hypothetical protein